MRIVSALVLLLFSPWATAVADDSASRVKVAIALALAQAGAAAQQETAITVPEVPPTVQSRWTWKYEGGDFAHLYLDGQYYATWSYSRRSYVKNDTETAQPTQPIRRFLNRCIGGE